MIASYPDPLTGLAGPISAGSQAVRTSMRTLEEGAVPVSSKVVREAILAGTPTGSALKADALHGIPNIVVNQFGRAGSVWSGVRVAGGDGLQVIKATMWGKKNGIKVNYEWVVRGSAVTHSFMRPI